MPPAAFHYDDAIENEIAALVDVIAKTPDLGRYPARWLAVQLLEDDEEMTERARQAQGGLAVLAALALGRSRLEAHYGDEVDVALADGRYRFVHSLASGALTRPATPPKTISDRIDRVVTNRYLGIPIFLGLMWVVFKMTTDISAPLNGWVDGIVSGPLTRWAAALMGAMGLGGTWAESLVLDGVIAGVGGVVVFVPVLMSLYLALGLLEDSGYMARAAFVMDRLMHALGLHGKSFLPMVVGFGCNVPGIYATRTLEHEKDRILTGLLVPFMSCSARLPVYLLLASVFFPTSGGLVVFSMYMLGIVVAVLVGMLLKHTLFAGQPPAPFVMELPPYRLPTLGNLWQQIWERTAAFLKKATTIIMGTSLVVWLLLAIPVGGSGSFGNTPVAESAFASVSRAFAPLFAPLGFSSWQTSGALVSGFVAKEVVVSTMAQVYDVEEASAEETPTFQEDLVGIGTSFGAAVVDTVKSIPLIVGINLFGNAGDETPTGLPAAIEQGFNQSSGGHGALAALAFMVFVLLYTPCMVAAAATRHELGSKWMWFSIFGQLGIAWVVAVIVFQVGRALGLG
ncbi:ferrous iron transport protein B [Chloroflexia bacterium SDU3-3]|nr:ferrous iron transport protein B [Chloroflexia bacterium SDU3-3]